MEFFKKIFSLKEDNIKIGLSQFKATTVKKEKPDVSICTKNVKLSDLMRRAS